MSVRLPQEKKDKIVSQYQVLLQEKLVSIRVLTQVLGRPSFTNIAVLVAPLQYWVSQRQTDCRTTKYAGLRFSSSFDRGSKKETAVTGMVEKFDKFTN